MSRIARGVVTVASDEVVTFTNEVSGFVFDQTVTTTLTIAGVVNFTTNHSSLTIAFDIASGLHRPGNAITITSTGRVTVEAAGDSNGVMGLYASNGTPDLINAGMFSIHGRVQAFGVYTADPSFRMDNSGVLRVRSDLKDATGVHAMSGSTITNTGLIEALGASTTVGIYSDGISNITNGGTIRAVSTGGRSAGIVVSHMASEISHITNTGLIEAENAIVDDSQAYSPAQDAVQIVHNSGQIRGVIDLGYGADQLVNTGSITGEVRLGRGDDLYDSRIGAQSGGAYGGFGRDRMLGGTGSDALFGEHDDDDIAGGDGDDVLGGGRGSDILDGGDGRDTVTYIDLTTAVDLDLAGGRATGAGTDTLRNIENASGSRWNDVIRGDAGANTLFGDAGADTLDGRAGNDVLAGGMGNDILTGGANADVFVFGTGDGADVITDFKADGERDILHIHGYSGYRALTQTAEGTLVVLSDTDSILLRGVSASSLGSSDFSFSAAPRPGYALPGRAPELLGATSWTITTSEQVYQGEVLQFDNATGGIGIVRNQLGAVGSLVNNGSIQATGDVQAAGANGVNITGPTSGGSFTNAAGATLRVTTANSISGQASGVRTDGMASVIDNRGDIIVRGAYNATGVDGLNFNLTVSNSGSLDVTAASTAYGVRLGQYGNVSNTGTVRVDGTSTVVGIYGVNAGSVVNAGSLVVVNRNGASIGIQITSDNATITNSGLIEATTAIQASLYTSSFFTTSGGITVRNTGDIRGAVVLSSGNDTLTSSGRITGTVSLGSGADQFDGSAATTAFTVRGEAGSDTLTGGTGDDTLEGGAGDDTLNGGAGSDTLDGGDGSDTAVYTGAFADYRLSVAGGILIVTGGDGADRLGNVEYLRFSDQTIAVSTILPPTAPISGTSGRDVLYGTTGNDTIYGFDGDDSISGEAGDDYLDGGDGNDQLLGGDGADIMYGYGGDDTLAGGRGDDVLNGGDGNDRLTGGDGNDAISGGAGLDIAAFSQDRASATITFSGSTITVASAEGRDTLTGIEALMFGSYTYDVQDGRLSLDARRYLDGTASADTLVGASANDTLRGLGGNDVLTGGGGSDVLDGGEGFDVSVYSGLQRGYAASSTTVSGGRDGGVDALVSIEEASFLDGRLSFDQNGDAAAIVRLYDATFDRPADNAGMNNWLAALGRGLTLKDIAIAFSQSGEFTGRYAGTTNDQFVREMYRFSLGREGDAAGIAGWVDHLASGRLTRAEVLLQFSESAEHRSQMAGVVNAGVWIQDETTLSIARLYHGVLDRLPDEGGLISWRTASTNGASLEGIASAFMASAEFTTRFGSLTNQQFVEQLYRFTLGREGDARGIQDWVNNLNSGVSRARVVLEFSESPEHINLTRAYMENGVVYEGYVARSSAEAGLVDEDASAPLTSPLAAADKTVPGEAGHDGDAFVLPAVEDRGPADTPLTLPAVGDDDLFLSDDLAATLRPTGGYGDLPLTLLPDDTLAFAHDQNPPWTRHHLHDQWA